MLDLDYVTSASRICSLSHGTTQKQQTQWWPGTPQAAIEQTESYSSLVILIWLLGFVAAGNDARAFCYTKRTRRTLFIDGDVHFTHRG